MFDHIHVVSADKSVIAEPTNLRELEKLLFHEDFDKFSLSPDRESLEFVKNISAEIMDVLQSLRAASTAMPFSRTSCRSVHRNTQGNVSIENRSSISWYDAFAV
jgi:hypothetical protein